MPVVGSVTLVEPVVVRVSAFAPEVVKAPAVVIAPPMERACPSAFNELMFVTACCTFVPSQNTNMVSPLGIATPVLLEVFIVTVCPAPFSQM